VFVEGATVSKGVILSCDASFDAEKPLREGFARAAALRTFAVVLPRRRAADRGHAGAAMVSGRVILRRRDAVRYTRSAALERRRRGVDVDHVRRVRGRDEARLVGRGREIDA
jgi:hypothetical protein